MSSLTTKQIHDIEFTAMKGKALASLLSLFCPLEECTPQDLQLSLCALEDYFRDILLSISPECSSTLPVRPE